MHVVWEGGMTRQLDARFKVGGDSCGARGAVYGGGGAGRVSCGASRRRRWWGWWYKQPVPRGAGVHHACFLYRACLHRACVHHVACLHHAGQLPEQTGKPPPPHILCTFLWWLNFKHVLNHMRAPLARVQELEEGLAERLATSTGYWHQVLTVSKGSPRAMVKVRGRPGAGGVAGWGGVRRSREASSLKTGHAREGDAGSSGYLCTCECVRARARECGSRGCSTLHASASCALAPMTAAAAKHLLQAHAPPASLPPSRPAPLPSPRPHRCTAQVVERMTGQFVKDLDMQLDPMHPLGRMVPIGVLEEQGQEVRQGEGGGGRG